MTKHKKKVNKNTSNNKQIIGLVVGLVVLAVGVFFMLNSTTDTNMAATIQPQKISPQDYQTTNIGNNTNHVLLDVRTPEEFASGYIAGAINIPVEELDQRLSGLPAETEIVVYCRSGNRSAQASTILSNNGFNDVSDMGGIIDWQQAGYSVES